MRYCPQCQQPALGTVVFCDQCQVNFIEIPTLTYIEDTGFEHPEWIKYFDLFQTQVAPEKADAAWRMITNWWMHRLVKNLGGSYRMHEDRNILLISDADQEECRLLSSSGNYSLELIQKLLGKNDTDHFKDRVVVLLFGDSEDYYDYISHFYPEGEFSNTIGCQINQGYSHIALNKDAPGDPRQCLVHELTHHELRDLPLPAWVNEALAMNTERAAIGAPFWLDAETASNLREFWNEDTIHYFWSGQSFHHPEASGISYSLAEVLWELIKQKRGKLAEFVREAHLSDAGQNAALKHLGFGLETLVEEFLGPGNWRPDRRKLAESFQRGRSESSTAE